MLGVNGQDGSYLAEVLIARGYAVTGAARQASSRWVDPTRFRYTALDVSGVARLDQLLSEVRPDEIYHMAAIHGSAGRAYEADWREALALNVGSVHTCLEHMRRHCPETRLFYPSSVKAFGANPPPVIDEKTPRVSDCLYGITKNAAAELIHYYRARHGIFAAIGYYFNHDSPRRSDSYFLPRLAGRIAAQPGQREDAPEIATLDFWCDWGSSGEFMELTADLLQTDSACDAIFATGRPVYATALAADLAA
ncbi:MAG: GDP-mannose 4,6-dehydratase, partial [Candidatus Sulfotelmatobacter sp.]